MSITFSSCFYIIHSKFDPSIYIEWMNNFISIVNNFNLVIYTDENSSKYINTNGNPKIKVIIKPLVQFHCYRHKNYWIKNHKANVLLNDKSCWELNMLWSEKIWFVKETLERKYFDTEFYGWCDIGYFRNRPEDTHTSNLQDWANNMSVLKMDKNKISYACITNDDGYLNYLNKIVNNKNQFGLPVQPIPSHQNSIAGGFFIIHKDKIDRWAKTYKTKLKLYFKHDYLVKDDQIILVDCILSDIKEFTLFRENGPTDNWFMFQRILQLPLLEKPPFEKPPLKKVVPNPLLTKVENNITKVENNITKVENNITKVENNITKVENNITQNLAPPFLKVVKVVSILMPIYNGIEFIEESVSSVLNQTYDKWELLIGINGHPQNSSVYTIAKNYERKSNKIKVFDFYNITGKANTLNEMVKHCNCNYIAILDVDDIWVNKKLEVQHKHFDTYDVIGYDVIGYDVIGSNCIWFGDRPGIIPKIPIGDISAVDFSLVNPIINSSSIIRKELCHWNENGIEDYDLWLRLRQLNKKIYNCSEILVKHRIHNQSAFNSKGNNDKVGPLLASHGLTRL
jgi:hypothetical protein